MGERREKMRERVRICVSVKKRKNDREYGCWNTYVGLGERERERERRRGRDERAITKEQAENQQHPKS